MEKQAMTSVLQNIDDILKDIFSQIDQDRRCHRNVSASNGPGLFRCILKNAIISESIGILN